MYTHTHAHTRLTWLSLLAHREGLLVFILLLSLVVFVFFVYFLQIVDRALMLTVFKLFISFRLLLFYYFLCDRCHMPVPEISPRLLVHAWDTNHLCFFLFLLFGLMPPCIDPCRSRLPRTHAHTHTHKQQNNNKEYGKH